MFLLNNLNLEVSEILNSRFLEVKLLWMIILSIISENEILDNDNYFVNGDDCNGMKKVKLFGIFMVLLFIVSFWFLMSLEF